MTADSDEPVAHAGHGVLLLIIVLSKHHTPTTQVNLRLGRSCAVSESAGVGHWHWQTAGAFEEDIVMEL